MTIDLLSPLTTATAPADPAAYWSAMTAAVADVSAPAAAISLAALRRNALDLVVRAGGLPVRVATKSVRVREVIEATLAIPGFAGVMAYSLAEALWLAEAIDDVLVGYPTADRAAIAALAADPVAASRVTLMVDDIAQLDLVDAVAAPGRRATVRVAIDADASWRTGALSIANAP